MQRRRIQLVGGSSYTVSLPKAWVQKNSLDVKKEVAILEKDDRTLIISPISIAKQEISEITIDVDKYEYLADIIFTVYYLGAETIELSSREEIDKGKRTQIRKTLAYLSGTEIMHESPNSITIKVLLDRSKIDIHQLMYRMSLIIEQSIQNLINEHNPAEVSMNEMEVDRLYNLIMNLITLSLKDFRILHSSKIKNISLVPHYFMINKKLESVSDEVEKISKLKTNEQAEDLLLALSKSITRSISSLMRQRGEQFKKTRKEDLEAIERKMCKISDSNIYIFMKDVMRYCLDIEETVVKISYYNSIF